MAEKFEYRIVEYVREGRAEVETEAEGVLRLLNNNGNQGWDLFKFEDSKDGKKRLLWMKRRVSN